MMAIEELKRHGLYDQGWRFMYDNAKCRFGSCRYHSKLITLSRPITLLNERDDVLDTILHEIAHALCPKNGHDSVWRAKAIEIGCKGTRCYSGEEINQPEMKYIGVCPGCKKETKKNRRSKTRHSCGKCSGGRFNIDYLIVYHLNPKYHANKLSR